jgi:hypothetical protein
MIALMCGYECSYRGYFRQTLQHQQSGVTSASFISFVTPIQQQKWFDDTTLPDVIYPDVYFY